MLDVKHSPADDVLSASNRTSDDSSDHGLPQDYAITTALPSRANSEKMKVRSAESGLDPPSKSNQDYNVLFAEHDSSRSAAQIHSFEDTWEWDMAAEAAYA